MQAGPRIRRKEPATWAGRERI